MGPIIHCSPVLTRVRIMANDVGCYVKSAFPDLVQYISHNLSPMGALAKYIKDTDPDSKVVFIGPSKKE